MCCLAFEAQQYQEMLKEMPKKGTEVTVEGKRGSIVDVMVLSKKARVELKDGTVVTVDVKEIK